MLDSFALPCRVRTTTRRGSIGLRVGAEEIRILAPKGTSTRVIEQMLRERQGWIETAIEAQRAQPRPQRCYQTGELLRYRGREYPLHVETGEHTGLRFDGQRFELRLPEPMPTLDERRAIIERWYCEQATARWPQQLEDWATRTGLSYRTLKIRTYKSRWGACTAKGNISLNTLLMMAPERVQTYVMIHELCHLRHLNHSADYWALVAQWCPDYAAHRRWLKQHGRELRF